MPLTTPDDVIDLIKKAPRDPVKFAFTLFGKDPTLYLSKLEPPKMVRDKLLAAGKAEKAVVNRALLIFGTVKIDGKELTFNLIGEKVPANIGKQIKRYFKLNKRTYLIKIADENGNVTETLGEDDDDDAPIAVPDDSGEAEDAADLVTRTAEDKSRTPEQIKSEYKTKTADLVAWFAKRDAEINGLLPSDAAYVRTLVAEGAAAWNGGAKGDYDIAFNAYTAAKKYIGETGVPNMNAFKASQTAFMTYLDTNGLTPKSYNDKVADASDLRRRNQPLPPGLETIFAISYSGHGKAMLVMAQKVWQKYQAKDDLEAIAEAEQALKAACDKAAAEGRVIIGHVDAEEADRLAKQTKVDEKLARAKGQLADPTYAAAVENVKKLITEGKDPAAALASTASKDFTLPVEGEDATLVQLYREQIQTAFRELMTERHAGLLGGSPYAPVNPGPDAAVTAFIDAQLTKLSTSLYAAFVKVLAGAPSEKSIDAAYKWAAAAHQGQFAALAAELEAKNTAGTLQPQVAEQKQLQDADALWRQKMSELDALILRASVADKTKAADLAVKQKAALTAFVAVKILDSTDAAATMTQLAALEATAGAYGAAIKAANDAIGAKRTAAATATTTLGTKRTEVTEGLDALKKKAGSIFKGNKDTLRVAELFEKAVLQLPDPAEVADDPDAAQLYADKATALLAELKELEKGPTNATGPLHDQAEYLQQIDTAMKKLAKADTNNWYKADLEKAKKALLDGAPAEGGEEGAAEPPADLKEFLKALKEFRDEVVRKADEVKDLADFVKNTAKPALTRLEEKLSALQSFVAANIATLLPSASKEERAGMAKTALIGKNAFSGEQGRIFKQMGQDLTVKVPLDPAGNVATFITTWNGKATGIQTFIDGAWDGKKLKTGDTTLAASVEKSLADIKAVAFLKRECASLKSVFDEKEKLIDSVLGTGEHDVLVNRVKNIQDMIATDHVEAGKQLDALKKDWIARKGALDLGKVDAGPAVLAKNWRLARDKMLADVNKMFADLPAKLPGVTKGREASDDAKANVAAHLSRLFHKSAFDMCNELIDPEREIQQKRELKESMIQQVKAYQDALVSDPICKHLQRNKLGQGALFTPAFAALKQAEIELLRYNP